MTHVALARARRGAFGALAAASLGLWAGGAQADTATVSIDNFTFSPAELTVAPGTSVTWTNADDIPHTVTATDKTFKSKPLDTNDRFTTVFASPGTYSYFCSLHPHMTGRIVVRGP